MFVHCTTILYPASPSCYLLFTYVSYHYIDFFKEMVQSTDLSVGFSLLSRIEYISSGPVAFSVLPDLKKSVGFSPDFDFKMYKLVQSSSSVSGVIISYSTTTTTRSTHIIILDWPDESRSDLMICIIYLKSRPGITSVE